MKRLATRGPRESFHEHFRPHYNDVPGPHGLAPLTGEDWGRLVEDDSDYYVIWVTGRNLNIERRFWRDTILVEQGFWSETANLRRQYWFIKIPPPGEWRSKAYTFVMPEPVKEQEATDGLGPAASARQVTQRTDIDRRVCRVHGPVCGGCSTTWRIPVFAVAKAQNTAPVDRTLLNIGDAVVFRFPGWGNRSTRVTVRKDQDTGGACRRGTGR